MTATPPDSNFDALPADAPADAAAAWFGRRRGGLRAQEEREFARWLEAAPEHRVAYEDVMRAWEWSGGAAGDAAIVAMRSEALMLRPARRRRAPVWAGLAASLLAVAGGTSLYLSGHPLSLRPAPRAADSQRILQTAIGERTTTTLDDGSVVTLDTNSRLRIAFTPGHRDVTLLGGQAFFQVAKDRSRPFIVTAGDRQVTAVGTEFEVRLDHGGAVRVALVEGRVKVQQVAAPRAGDGDAIAAPPQMLAPGDLLLASAAGAVSVKPVDLTGVVSWREGRVRFDETALADAVAEMNRYSKVRIVIADPRIATLRISGAFRTGQSAAFVDAIGEAFPVRGEQTPEGIVLHAAG